MTQGQTLLFMCLGAFAYFHPETMQAFGFAWACIILNRLTR